MAIILRQNVGMNLKVLLLLMETAKERKADLVMVQEPPSFEDNSHPTPTFCGLGVMTARRKDGLN